MKTEKAEQLALCEAIRATLLKSVGDIFATGKVSGLLAETIKQMHMATADGDVPALNLNQLDKEELELAGLKEKGEYMVIPSWMIPFVNAKDKIFNIETGAVIQPNMDVSSLKVIGTHTNLGVIPAKP